MSNSLIARNCCVCGSSDAQVLLMDQGYPIGRCAACGFVYCLRIPDSEALEEHYTFAYADTEAWLRKMSLGRKWVFADGLATLKRLGAHGRLLDVGCSVGLFLNAARGEGFDVQGIELSPEPARFARNRFHLDVQCGTVETATWPYNSFDVITLWDVLEHLPDPRATLQSVARLLRPGGWLAIRVPDAEFHLWKTRMLRPWFGHRFIWMEVPNHLNHFRPRTLSRLLDQTGFDVVLIRPGPPHFYGRCVDMIKVAYYSAARFAQRNLKWQLGNIFEVYAQRHDDSGKP